MSDAERAPMLSVAEARARLAALFTPLPAEDVPLAKAAGRVLAEDVVARRAQPPFDASAMDGYAIGDGDHHLGARLAVIGASVAGQGFEGRIGPGEAVRIFTGAPVPEGADRVLIQEDAERIEDWVAVRALGEGANIRAAGADFAPGARIAAPRRIGAREMALMAAMNAGVIRARRRPVVALLATGDELVMPGDDPGRDQIICSNSFGLKAMLEAAGAEARLLPIARDTPESLIAAFDLATGGPAPADLIVTLGGASVGDHDLVRSTALGRGLDLAFYKIAMRPGKPLMAGRLSGVPMLGLPGNPVSAMVCGLLFARPAVEAMLGLEGGAPARLHGALAGPLGRNGPREHYMRARVAPSATGWICEVFERQDSSLLAVLAEANALVVRAPGDPERAKGDVVEFIWMG